jgi:hypothetical protein
MYILKPLDGRLQLEDQSDWKLFSWIFNFNSLIFLKWPQLGMLTVKLNLFLLKDTWQDSPMLNLFYLTLGLAAFHVEVWL